MKTLPDTHVREASSCPSPVTIWQTLLSRLLGQHYGLTLNDTPFADERVIEQHIEAGISLCDAVNFLVEKYALVRTDQPGFSTCPRSQLINSIDILRARRATGLMTRDNYRTVASGETMKLSLMLEADRINVQALNMGQIVVDVDGVNLTELINKVAENGYSLRVVEESDQQSTCTLPPFATLAGIRCSTAHITEKDNAWLYSLSHQTSDVGESEWIHFTGSGYLLRTDAWSYPVLRLKRLGLSKTFRRLVITLTRRYGVSLIHLDASAECLPGLPTFNW